MFEARMVAQAFKAGRPSPERPLVLAKSPPVELRLIGMGAGRLPQRLDRKDVCGIILAGIAGALDPGLAVGDVVADCFPEGLLDQLSLRRGKIHTSPHMISTPAEKAELFRQTHAHAVDMESEPVRKLAELSDLPLAVVRGISDAADHVLDPAIFKFVDDVGRPKLSALAPALVRNPGLVQTLTRIRYNANLAASAMAGAVRQLAADRNIWRSQRG